MHIYEKNIYLRYWNCQKIPNNAKLWENHACRRFKIKKPENNKSKLHGGEFQLTEWRQGTSTNHPTKE